MNLLILGGTRFVGRHLVEAALERGFDVTLFNRGQSAPGLYPAVREIHGDRATDLDRLGEGRYDAVIDTCGYLPGIVAGSVAALLARVDRYVFISTLSVYDIDAEGPLDESHPLASIDDPSVSEVTPETYGGLKVLCEEAVTAAFGARSLILRPGLIVGPYDPTDRFTYWPWRVAQGGEILAPSPPEQAIQVVDARDLAAFTLDALEGEARGPFNVCGPLEGETLEGLLETCRVVSGVDGRVTWVDEAQLLKASVAPYSELPLWVPRAMARHNAFSAARAAVAGLSTRPMAETVADTLAWLDAAGHRVSKAGLTPARETELLSAWAARGGSR